MAKRIISQRRGKGSPTYTGRKRAFRFKIKYPKETAGVIEKIFHSPAHSAPLIKIKGKESYYNIAAEGIYEGQIISDGIREGNIVSLKNIPVGKEICNIELRKGDGGRIVRTGGSFAVVTKKEKNSVTVRLPSRKEIELSGENRATIGKISSAGRKDKPIMKAGKMYYIKKGKSILWPRTSAVKMNAVEHPFGSGRGKRIKSKIAKRNAPPGAKVGLLRPKKTGKRK